MATIYLSLSAQVAVGIFFMKSPVLEHCLKYYMTFGFYGYSPFQFPSYTILVQYRED